MLHKITLLFSRQLPAALALTAALLLSAAQPTLAQSPSAPVVGQPLPTLTLQDQRNQPWQVTPATKLLLFAASRKASDMLQGVLDKLPKDYMQRHSIMYLADMSKMPAFITRTFALPVLEKMPYAIGVALDSATLSDWPRQKDAVTLIELDQGQVKRVSYASTEAQLRAALGAAP